MIVAPPTMNPDITSKAKRKRPADMAGGPKQKRAMPLKPLDGLSSPTDEESSTHEASDSSTSEDMMCSREIPAVSAGLAAYGIATDGDASASPSSLSVSVPSAANKGESSLSVASEGAQASSSWSCGTSTVSESHVYRVDGTDVSITPDEREAIETLIATRHFRVPAVAQQFGIPAVVVMHIWNGYRKRNDIPAMLI